MQTMRVPWAMSSAVDSRRALVSELRALGVDPVVVDECEIVISELVTNAVRHAKPLSDGKIRVKWSIRVGVVEIEVTDGGGPTTPRPAPRSVWSAGGRGLRNVGSLAHEWGVGVNDTGRTVGASVGCPPSRPRHRPGYPPTRVGEHGQGIEASCGGWQHPAREPQQRPFGSTSRLRGPTF